MNERIRDIKNFSYQTWVDAPWIRAAGILGATATGLLFLNTILPAEVAINLASLDSSLNQIYFTSILIMYFFLVAIFAGDRLRFEKKLRALEQNFKYDNRGTLYNGREPNIAFRITTFRGILEGISGAVGATKLADVLTDTGRLASNDFAMSLKEIYDKDVASRKLTSSWDELSLNEKLSQWAEYDSATGWGIIACSVRGDSIKVVINHLQDLFNGNGGLMFGHFLGGYTETIISFIVNNHLGGKFNDYGKAELINTNQSDKYTLELEFILK